MMWYAMRSPSRVWMMPRANRNAATMSQTVDVGESRQRVLDRDEAEQRSRR